jgi:hypothetical protein
MVWYLGFDEAGRKMAVVRQTIRKWRAVVKYEFIRLLADRAWPAIDRGLEGAIFPPPFDDFGFDFREIGILLCFRIRH